MSQLQSKSRRAREAAVELLIAAHPEEYAVLHKGVRAAAGLRDLTAPKLCKRCDGEMDRKKQGARYCTKCSREARLEAQARHNRKPQARAKQAAYARAKRARIAAAKPKREPKPEPKRVPSEVRALWAKADENSAIRRRWPTPADLARAAEEGHFAAAT